MPDRWRGFEIAFTGMVAFFTVVLAIVSIKQQETARKALRRATESADAAKIAADAAVKQAKVADEAMRIGLRPYVQVGDPDSSKPVAVWITEKGKRIGIKVYFWNAGSTPGSRLRVNGYTVPGTMTPFHHLEMQPVSTKYGGRSWTGGAFIPARGATSVPIAAISEPQIAEEFAAVKRSKQIFDIEGNFEYMNVFNEWCCESYCLTLDSKGRFTTCMGGLRSFVCARSDNVVNVCEQKGELKVPYYPQEKTQ